MPHKLPSGRWRAQIRREELGYYKGVFDTRAEAVAWEKAKLGELLTKKAKESGQGTSLATVADEYFVSSRFLRKAEGTKRREKSAAQAVLNRWNGKGLVRRPWSDRPVELVDATDINAYIGLRMAECTQRGKPVSPDSIRLEVRLLSAVMKHAVRERYRTSNPALARLSGLDMPTTAPREGRISEAQELKLEAAARGRITGSKRSNPSLYPWLIYVRETRSRPGEAAKIELSWIDLDKKVIDIPRRGSKKRTPRRVILTDDMVGLVTAQRERALRDGSKYLFYSQNRRTKDWQPFRYSSAWRSIRAEAGVESEAHGMRREGISRLFESSSLTDGQIALLVGDVNPMSLEPYKHLRAGELRPQLEAFRQAQIERSNRVEAAVTKQALLRLGIKPEQLPAEFNAWLEGASKPDMGEEELPVAGSDARPRKRDLAANVASDTSTRKVRPTRTAA